MAKPPDPLTAATAEIERRSRVMAGAQRFSPYGRAELGCDAYASAMAETTTEPGWLTRLRGAAVQRPRTQFDKVRWADLAQLLRERDFLLSEATPEAKATLETMQENYHAAEPRTAEWYEKGRQDALLQLAEREGAP